MGGNSGSARRVRKRNFQVHDLTTRELSQKGELVYSELRDGESVSEGKKAFRSHGPL